LLSLAKGNEPIKIRWNKKLGRPIFATITWNPTYGWVGSFILEKNIKQYEDLLKEKVLAIDLGVKRIATTFDGNNCITYTGKEIRSLIRYREKIKSQMQSKMSGYKKHGKRWKKFNTAKRNKIRKINNKINDILHKYSRTIVNYAIENKISQIVVGDNSSTHNAPNLKAPNNQLITQGVEQKLAKLIQFKFESIGGIYSKIPEPYTSKTCPKCGTRNESRKKTKKLKDGTEIIISDRVYKCKHCQFEYDRDGVGSINIWGLGKKVSLGKIDPCVIGGLTPPSGFRYKPGHKCFMVAPKAQSCIQSRTSRIYS
jgi:putative transposase